MQPSPSSRLSSRTWIVMFALALTGQIAWAVENSWFNTFVYDTITPDPRPIAWMRQCHPHHFSGWVNHQLACAHFALFHQ
jgi:hypothetical protein